MQTSLCGAVIVAFPKALITHNIMDVPLILWIRLLAADSWRIAEEVLRSVGKIVLQLSTIVQY